MFCNAFFHLYHCGQCTIMLSWSSFNQYSAVWQYSLQATGCFPQKPVLKKWTAVREEWILLQWLSSILTKNIGRAVPGGRTSLKTVLESQHYPPFPKMFSAVTVITDTFNSFPHNDTFWHPWETSLLKTLWGEEKLLVTSNFSLSHSVFYPFG